MYIDIFKTSDKYKSIIYHNEMLECITSSDIDTLFNFVVEIILIINEDVYIDKRGFGIGLTDLLDSKNIPYKQLKVMGVNLDKMFEIQHKSLSE